jgi:hypothetical protein
MPSLFFSGSGNRVRTGDGVRRFASRVLGVNLAPDVKYPKADRLEKDIQGEKLVIV